MGFRFRAITISTRALPLRLHQDRASTATYQAWAHTPASRLRRARSAWYTTCTRIYAQLFKIPYDAGYGYCVMQRDGFRGSDYNRAAAECDEDPGALLGDRGHGGIQPLQSRRLWDLRSEWNSAHRCQCVRSSARFHPARRLSIMPATCSLDGVCSRPRSRCCCESNRT